MKKIAYFILLAASLAACEREEIPVKKHDPGAVTTASVNMEGTYKWQIYYDLSTQSVVGQNPKTSWDLGFECSANGFHVVLNTSKSMFSWNTGITDFASVQDTNGFQSNMKWDASSGNPDSTAIGDWRENGFIYIIDRGYSDLGKHMGFRKIRFDSVDQTRYVIHFSTLDGSDDRSFTIEKNDNFNFTFFSFDDQGKTVEVEPAKSTWDLCFTQYTHIFYEEVPVTPYQVTGCLINRCNTFAVLDTLINFETIDYSYAKAKLLSGKTDAIGYDWKTFSGSQYTTHPEMNYIIQDRDGHIYKLHFIDFYNAQGIKGNPQFEFQQL